MKQEDMLQIAKECGCVVSPLSAPPNATCSFTKKELEAFAHRMMAEGAKRERKACADAWLGLIEKREEAVSDKSKHKQTS